LDGKNAGSGKPFSWQSINESSQDLSTCYLAGGLSSENIDQAVAFLLSQDLVGLDVNSGVESSPGIKNHQKLQQIFAQIRNY
jgi:indole-3-glycerol phosphate synthase/phosphoribosylanthranilate isomerase